jgi:Leucine-rich repeat (LRR) protein
MRKFFYVILIIVFFVGCNSNKVFVKENKIVERDKKLLTSHYLSLQNNKVSMCPGYQKKQKYFIPKKLYNYPEISTVYIYGYSGNIDINKHLYQILSELSSFSLSGSFPFLNNLTITNCDIEYIPKSISYIRNLERLNLTNNRIKDIAWEISYLDKLTYINLAKNNLGRLTDKEINNLLLKLSTVKNLKTLFLTDNFFEEIPENIKYLTNLEFLYIGYNYLKCFPCIVTELPNLKSLTIDYSEELLSFPECIDNFPKGVIVNLLVRPPYIEDYKRENIELLKARYPNVRWSAP